jgi:hypothetical protein
MQLSNGAPTHHSWVRIVVWRRTMHGPTVVPDRKIILTPFKVVDKLWLRGMRGKLLNQGSAFF